MKDSWFWRLLAVAAVAGVFYLGHGMHQSDNIPALPTLLNSAQADDIANSRPPGSLKDLQGAPVIITRSPDGKTLYIFKWAVEKNEPKIVHSETVAAT